MRIKGSFQFEIITNVFSFHLNTYVNVSKAIIIVLFFQCGDRLWTSESDVYARQILASRVGPHAERIKYL